MLCTVPRESLDVEEVAKQFDHAAVRTMADQHQGQDQLPQPSLGDGQIEKHLVGLGRGSEGLAERLLGGVSLLVEELPADLMLPSQLRDRFCPGEDLDGQVLPLRRQESLGRPGDRSEVRLRETEGRRSLTIHARFLRVGRGIASPAPIWRKRVFLRNPDSVNGVLPDFEPGPFFGLVQSRLSGQHFSDTGSRRSPCMVPSHGFGDLSVPKTARSGDLRRTRPGPSITATAFEFTCYSIKP